MLQIKCFRWESDAEKGGGQCKGDRSECGQLEKEGRSIGQQSATQIYMFLMYICVGFGNGVVTINHADNKWPRMFVCVCRRTRVNKCTERA